MHKIIICSAMMIAPEGELLVVRKRGSEYFQLPGGKIAVGESDLEALVRELREELHYDAGHDMPRFIGRHVTRAVNEPDTLVEGHIYLIRTAMKFDFPPHAELEEVQWINTCNWQEYRLAHLAEEFVVPKWLAAEF